MPVSDHEVVLVPQDQYKAIDYLVGIWEGVGKPTEPFSKSGLKVLAAMIEAWKVLMPEEYLGWKQVRDEYQSSELDVHDQVKKKTGRIVVSMPRLFITLFHKLFPGYDTDRKFFIKLGRHFPIFRFARKI